MSQSTGARGPHRKNPTTGLLLNHERYMVIGDVHGCYDELLLLLNRYHDGRHVVYVGDLVDKGPRPHRVMELAKLNRSTVALGNHEENHIRYAAHEDRRCETGKKNPMKRDQEFKDTHRKIMDSPMKLRKFMEKMPHFVRLQGIGPGGRDVVVVHGGLLPGHTPESMDAKKIVRCRQLKKIEDRYTFATLMESEETPGLPHWTDLYQGKDYVLFGHHPFINPPIKNRTVGLDTGCVYGNRLTAMLLPEMQIVQVQARREYLKKEKW